MKTIVAMVTGLALCGFGSLAIAEDGPTGTWKWEFKSGQVTQHIALKLKVEGDKLTGSMTTTRTGEEAYEDDGKPEKVENGTYKDGVVSFAIFRKLSVKTTVSLKFSGKVEGNTIKGETISDNVPMGKPPVKGPWEAKRAAE